MQEAVAHKHDARVINIHERIGGTVAEDPEMPTAQEVDMKISIHEAVCAERYAGINARLRRIEGILLGGAGTIIVALLGIAWQVATHS